MYPSVSFTILTRNSEKTILLCLKSIASLDYPKNKMEIIIVDGNSTDDTIPIVTKFAEKNPELKVRILNDEGKGIGFARRLSVDAAKNEVLAIVDSDRVIQNKDWLKKMVEPLEVEEIAGSFALGIPANEKNSLARYYGNLAYLEWGKEKKMVKSGRIGTGNTLIKKEIVKKAGNFPELRTHEDVELTKKVIDLGYCFAYLPECAILHYGHPETLSDLVKKELNYARNNFIKQKMLGSSKQYIIKRAIMLLFIPILLIYFVYQTYKLYKIMHDIAASWHLIVSPLKIILYFLAMFK